MKTWDASALLGGDPDQPGGITIQLLCNPDFPLPLSIVECAANLDVTIRIKKPELQDIADLVIFDVTFEGRCLDLSELDMRMIAWTEPHAVKLKSHEEVSNERNATSATPNAPSGADGSTD